ncbi:MAG TPA: hypothetical protein PK006_07990 [Saprospiraceae bacterium]|nr:hypothetical protein [Saprospiraceae bacterium]
MTRLIIGLIFLTHLGFAQQTKPNSQWVKKINTEKVYFTNQDSMTYLLSSDKNQQTIFAFFHSEEDTIGIDPGLSTDGRWRAIHLLKLLKPLQIQHFFSTPFRRNILTIQPLTDEMKKQVVYYDQADLNVLYKKLDVLFPKPVVLMIHQQTFQKIVQQLTGQTIDNKDNDSSPKRFFILQRTQDNQGNFYSLLYNIR